MSDSIRYETDLSGARWKLSKLKGMPFLMGRKLNYWGARTVEHIMRNLGGSILNTRTGHLKRNIAFKPIESEGTYGIAIGTGPDVGKREVKYASIHEHGGRITPKRAKNLTIPLGPTKGTVAMHPEALSPKGKLNVMKTRTGKLIIFARTARGIKPLFLLKKEVRIPPRYWLSRSIGEMKTMLDMMMQPQQIIEDLFAGGGRED